jgi:hypothetical protein
VARERLAERQALMAKSLVRKAVNFPDIQFTDPKLARLMEFLRGQANEIQRLQSMLAGGTSDQALIKKTTGDYDAAWADQTDGTITGAKNVGAGKPIFVDVETGLLVLRSLIPGDNITLVQGTDSITIAAADAPSGGGTVTQVAIISNDLDVSGSPIETEGDIELEIKPAAVTYAKIQDTSADAVLIGRNIYAMPGSVMELTLSEALDMLVGGPATWGQVLFRGESGWQYLSPGTEGQALTTHGADVDPTWETSSAAVPVGATFTNGVTAMTAPTNDVDVPIQVAGTLVMVEIVARGGPGSIAIDVLKTDFATFPTTASICGGTPPSISSGSKMQDATLSGWTTAVSAGDVLTFRLLSTSTLTSATIKLYFG